MGWTTGKRVALLAAAHAAVSALFWVWMGAVALGLGFKDRATWTLWDHFQVEVVPTIGLTITSPGRFFFFGGWTGIIVPWLINSFLWSVGFVAAYEWMCRRERRSSG